MKCRPGLGFGLLLAAVAGCGPGFSEKARNGITFYVPGAGNIDFGDAGIREGLAAAGYRGELATVVWTVGFNPLVDQRLGLNARLAASGLADAIRKYIDRYPGRSVNIIGLSAGTGIAMWALENLPDSPKYMVDNVILLGSSLSYRYDVSKALRHVKGKIYNYYSSQDPVLAGPMKVFGTIDGQFFVEGAGEVGLHPPRGADRVENIPWRPEFSRYGYHGGHTDSTSPAFVRAVLSRHILPTVPSTRPGRAVAHGSGSGRLSGELPPAPRAAVPRLPAPAPAGQR